MSSLLISTLVPRQEPCHARSGLSEGTYFECELSRPARVTNPANLSEHLTDSYNLGWKRYRIHIADMELSVSRYQTEDRFRLDEVDAFTNPQIWKREALSAPPHKAASGFLLFDVPYDEDEVVYTVGDRADLVFDAQNARLQARFTEGAVEGRWIELADTLFAIVDGPRLLGLQFESFTDDNDAP